MQTPHFRNKLDLFGRKIVLSLLFFCCIGTGFAQNNFSIFNPSGQDDQFFSYGFFLAAHTGTYRIKYSDAFLDPEDPRFHGIQSIQPIYQQGFSLGFLVTMRLHDQVNLLFTPKVGFYEHVVQINNFVATDFAESGLGIRTEEALVESTLVEFPLLLKYKSQRFNNTRMYFIGGGNYSIRTKAQDEADEDPISTLGQDLALEMGLGFDFYFKFFKFSPEIRFSHGLFNIYRPQATDPAFADAITDIRRKSITLYLNFQ
ncbi:type IX secretion/gliding motility protein PorT/SprT [Pararhodonellum marinum]|uniref:type IX secretion/gliding motility protein PorT/SprT n=1 Tax=Pararhodonellum marinum TaxID=2755358 RepID=UPI001890A784|nr:outer membrane beta-barrel protein [Pararhodonellum marinum]